MAGIHQLINTFSNTQYLLITIASYSFFIFQAYHLLKSFDEKDTGTRIAFESIENVQFPSFTICHLNFMKGYDRKVCTKNGIFDASSYMNGEWQSNDTNKSPKKLYNEITLDPYDIVSMIAINFKDNSELFLKKNDFTENITKITDVSNKGKCFTVNLSYDITKKGIKRIMFTFDIKQLYTIYLHHKHQLYNSIHYNAMEGKQIGYKEFLVDFEVQ